MSENEHSVDHTSASNTPWQYSNDLEASAVRELLQTTKRCKWPDTVANQLGKHSVETVGEAIEHLSRWFSDNLLVIEAEESPFDTIVVGNRFALRVEEVTPRSLEFTAVGADGLPELASSDNSQIQLVIGEEVA